MTNRNDETIHSNQMMIRVSNPGDMTIIINTELVRQAILEAEAKAEAKKVAPGIAALQHKREMRLSLVRERIRAEKEAMEESKKKELDKKRKEERNASMLDLSEHARRLHAYTRYTHLGMPARQVMKERAGLMPLSAGLSIEDVDLLPWSHDGEIVNVAKMQKFVNEDYKKKFPRKKAAAADR
jgi:hypothetical protein